MKRPLCISRLGIYALLIGGSLFFSLPFVWMLTTSVKVDRELFTPGLHLLPTRPLPRHVSPYVDTDYYRLGDEAEPSAELLQGLRRVVREQGPELPGDLDRDETESELALGLYLKLKRILPDDVWAGPPAGVIAAARERAHSRVLAELLADVHRRLCFGQLRVRSHDHQEQELGADKPYSRRLANLTPDTLALSDRTDKTIGFASLNYDFSRGNRAGLSQTFDLDFDATRLQRIQLYMRPDDTWHELWLTVEKNGIRYRSDRAVALSNSTWTMVTWQEPSRDDNSTKIKTWVLLLEEARSPNILSDARKLKLTFELRRSSQLRAWWNKLRLNYDRVLDHIPFWRYVRTSLFLVAINIVFTLLSCSLVAYAFARLTWPGRDVCFVLMLATLMIPGQVTMIPHFLIWKSVGAYNTLVPLWLGRAFGNAFFIFLLRQFLKGVPRDLEDAARIDGCGFLRIYWHIMLPLIKPSLAAIAIFTFMGTWNDFMGPLVYIADQRLYPLAFGLYAFSVQVGNNPALTMAGGLLMTLPVIVIFFFAQKYFIQGVTLTGMKA